MKGPDVDVSVLIAAWNAAETLERAVSSALAQTGVKVEVIVVDDASGDDTLACATRMAEADPRVIARAMPRNSGPAAARNLALQLACGAYVTVLDSDDMMEPGRLRSLVSLAKAESVDAVADDLWRVDADNPEGPRSRLLGGDHIGWRSLDLAGFVDGNLTTANGSRGEMGFLKPLIKRAFLDLHGLRYDERMRLGEDYMLYAEMLGRGARFYLTDPHGYLAFMRGDSLSARHSATDLGALVAADKVLKARYSEQPSVAHSLGAHLLDTKKRWQWMRLIDAVKERNMPLILRCFGDDPRVSLFLLARLWEQVLLRSRRRLGGA